MVALTPAIVNVISLLCVASMMPFLAILVIAMLMRQIAPLISEPLRKSFKEIEEINMP